MKTILSIILMLSLPGIACGLPAFPGAEGMGADSVGGRGGIVCVVDSLSDDPVDGQTFRECAEMSGARYITFSVSGIIDLMSNLIIDDPYITIAGETSPGGIAVIGSQTNINTHNVIIRHMRFRLGAIRVTAGNAEQVGDAVEIGEYTTIITDPTQYNIILDHCSFSWGIDETVSAVCNTSDITFSYCRFTNGLFTSVHPESPHSAGFLAWGKYAQNIRVSIHHSFFGFNMFRNPEGNYNSLIDSKNNVVYGFKTTRTHEIGNQTGYTSTANLVNNFTKTSSSDSTSYARTAYIILYDTNNAENVYMTGNLDGTRTLQTDPQWSLQEYWNDVTASTNWQRLTPWPTTGFSGTGIPVNDSVMSESYASFIIANSGATMPVRDGVDIATTVLYNAGGYQETNSADVDTIEEITALINLSSPAAPTDSDSDGMEDAWEITEFGDLSQSTNTDFDSDGYKDIEEYFHYLAQPPSQLYRLGGNLILATN